MKKLMMAKRFQGAITVPGDKSISHRAVMLGAISIGDTRVKGLLECDDCRYTANALRAMGVKIDKKNGVTLIRGRGLHGLSKPAKPLYVGESGTTMRLMAGLLAGQDFESRITGSRGLSRRPMRRIAEPLSLMGAKVNTAKGGFPPLAIRGGALDPISYVSPVASAQIKSAILLAGLYADGITKVREPFKSRDHTERMLKYFGARIKVDGNTAAIEGGRELGARSFDIPGDMSSAAFFIVGATVLGGSNIKIQNVSINPTRTGILKVMSRMGADIRIINRKYDFEPSADIVVSSVRTRGTTIKASEVPAIIDELPVIFVLAAISAGRTVIKGAGELRVKETDRITSMTDNLSRMGARISLSEDDIVIDGVRELEGAALKSFGDHRTCMSMAIAALAASGESVIDDVACVNKSFPEFFDTLKTVVR